MIEKESLVTYKLEIKFQLKFLKNSLVFFLSTKLFIYKYMVASSLLKWMIFFSVIFNFGSSEKSSVGGNLLNVLYENKFYSIVIIISKEK